MIDVTCANLWPAAASDNAHAVDRATLILLALSAVVILIVAGLVLSFSLRYRESARRRPTPRELPSRRIEIGWASVITLVFLTLFILGAASFINPPTPQRPEQRIYVVGKQWMWKVQHPSGQREINELHLAVGEPVRLMLISQDVIHSLYIPAFRIKQDALPGRFTTLSFTPTRAGVFPLRCAEYCGTDHAHMTGHVIVQPPDAHQQWLDSGADITPRLYTPPPPLPLARQGHALFIEHGCPTCHMDADTPRAPRLDGIFGRETRTEAGELLLVDESYIRESLLRPNARIVASYGPVSEMPSYQGRLTDEEILALIEYLRALRDGGDMTREARP